MLLYLLGLLCLFLDSFANNKQNLAILTNNLTGLMNNTPAAKVSPLIPKKPIIKPVKPLKPIVKPPVVMPSPELQLLKESSAMPHPFTEYQLGKCKIRLVVQDILQEPADAIVNAANSRCLGGGGIDWAISNAGGAGPTGYADGKRQRTTLHDLRFALPVLPDDVRCPERESRITRGGWLSYNFNDKLIGNHNPRSTYNYVIHAVGPKCGGVVTAIEKEQVAVTYINALSRVEAFNIRPKDPHYIEFEKIDTSDLGKNYQIRSLNFPTISTGIYGCKTVDTVDSVIESVLDYITAKTNLTINQINFVFWNPSNPSKATADYNLYKAAFAKYLKK